MIRPPIRVQIPACSVCGDDATQACERGLDWMPALAECGSLLCADRKCKRRHGRRFHDDGRPGGNEDERNARRDDV